MAFLLKVKWVQPTINDADNSQKCHKCSLPSQGDTSIAPTEELVESQWGKMLIDLFSCSIFYNLEAPEMHRIIIFS